jgi:hypothetical protein
MAQRQRDLADGFPEVDAADAERDQPAEDQRRPKLPGNPPDHLA